MLVDEPAYVLGHGNSAAKVAMILLNFTDDVDLLVDGNDPEWDDDVDEQVRVHPLTIIDEEVVGAFPEDEDVEDPWLGGLEFADGTKREYAGGFPMYGKRYNNRLATVLGCELADDGAVVVDEHGRTSVKGVYAVGDLTPGQNQISVAMGEGTNAGIAIHKELRSFPMSLDEIDAHGEVEEQDVPAMPEELRKRAHTINDAERHEGMFPTQHYPH